ncbi:hypothetical protein BDN67DRAFT_967255 [Paxillus ammoniavirescens]|nr:hypothetical protein BDN67DRAFT_967255 [Paxillus ammoniavirescens]
MRKLDLAADLGETLTVSPSDGSVVSDVPFTRTANSTSTDTGSIGAHNTEHRVLYRDKYGVDYGKHIQ